MCSNILLSFFKTGFRVAEVDFELTMQLGLALNSGLSFLQAPHCWDYKHMPLPPALLLVLAYALFLKIYLFLFYVYGCLLSCMFVYQACTTCTGWRGSRSYPWDWSFRYLGVAFGSWALNPGPLEEYPELSPLKRFTWYFSFDKYGWSQVILTQGEIRWQVYGNSYHYVFL